MADGLVETVCEELGQVVGVKNGEPVVERVTTAVLEMLLLAEGEPVDDRSPERVFERSGEALRLL